MSDPKALKLFLYVMRTLKDANGRSNFNKSLQYGAKLAAVMLAEGDKKSVMAARFNAASAMVSNGRKLGFLGMVRYRPSSSFLTHLFSYLSFF